MSLYLTNFGNISSFCRFSYIFMLILILTDSARAETVALWLFDDPVDSSKGAILKDVSGNGYDLTLGSGRIVADGKFGNALFCPERVTDFVARRLHVESTPLGLSNRDWTVELWQRRDAPVARGYVDWIYLLCDNAIDPSNKDWQKSFQTEARFSGMGLWSHDKADSWFQNPVWWSVFVDKLDEVNRLSFTQDVTPDFYAGEDSHFHHIAWVYDSAIKRLSYFEDGKGPFYIRDGSSVAPGNQTHAVYGILADGPLEEYPDAYSAYNRGGDVTLYVGGENFIGPDAETGIGIEKIPEGYRLAGRPRQEQTSRSLIDEIRISDTVLYRQPFSPPPSFAGDVSTPWMKLSRRRLDFMAVRGLQSPDPQTFTISNLGEGVLVWKAETQADWVKLSSSSGRVSDKPTQVTVSVDPTDLLATAHTAEITLTSEGAESPKQTVVVRLRLQSADSVVWLFDEPLDSPHRFQLEDQAVNGYDLTLGPGGKLVPGKFGNALDPRGGRKDQAAIRRYIDQTHLNLGCSDWTWECWVNLEEQALEGDVLFMIRENLRVGPYPHLAGVGAACGLEVGPDGQSLRFISRQSGIEGVLLKTDRGVMSARTPPERDWHHLALSYDASRRQLTHWVNGQERDSVMLPSGLSPMNPTGENNISIGKTIEGRRPWRGLIDEMRISATCRYREEFSPPATLAPAQGPVSLGTGPHLFIDDFLIAAVENLQRVAHQPEWNTPEPPGWEEFSATHRGNIVDAGPDFPDPSRRYREYMYKHSYTAVPVTRQEGGGIHLSFAASRGGPWTDYENNPIIPYVWAGQPDSTNTVSDISSYTYDPATGLYVMIFKTTPLAGENPELAWYRDERWNYQNRVLSGYRRLVGMATSRDGIHWSDFQRIFVPDDVDEGETQWLSCVMSKRGDLYLIHAVTLRDDVDRSVSWSTLASSRDLYHWKRYREPFIPYLVDPARGDKVILISSGFFAYDNYHYFGYNVGGSHKPPRRWYPTFARIPIDRYVSRDAVGETPGRLLTVPLQLTEEGSHRLVLNADASNGQIRAQLRDPQTGHVLPGYGLDQCESITSDGLELSVVWREKEYLPRKALQIEFEITGASLFGFSLLSKVKD